MKNTDILVPVCLMVLLTILVWVWMYTTRISTMFRKKIKSQSLADADSAAWTALKGVVNPSDNLENLFEVPVLFYLAAVLIYTLQLTDTFYLNAAYAFVALRYLHSFIHCTYNRIIHRFTAYFLGSLVLWIMWFRLIAKIVSF